MRKVLMTSSPKITPHLWFDKEAKEAAAFYCSVFPNSKITCVSTISGVPTPSGDCDIVSFELAGQPFMGISAGPLFKFNEAISFLIPCETQDEIDHYWEKLSPIRRLNSAAGSRISSACRGKCGRERWAR
jgi:predicted 3-demethylubiquinone-9 3-methyltransferase (glyoxalase superfamily)